MANPAKAYLATQVETTTQGELLLMLYEAAIKFLKRAKKEIERKDYAKKGIYISKALAIIHELAESLNKEKGGDITPKLGALYQFCTSQLIKANIRLDTKMVDEVIKILDGLRSAYAQIVPEYDAKTSGVQGTVSMQGKSAAAAQAPGEPKQPMAPQPVQPLNPQVQAQQATPAPKQQEAETPDPAKNKPVQQQTATPPKMRTAANAAKFRAANAYTNTVR